MGSGPGGRPGPDRSDSAAPQRPAAAPRPALPEGGSRREGREPRLSPWGVAGQGWVRRGSRCPGTPEGSRPPVTGRRLSRAPRGTPGTGLWRSWSARRCPPVLPPARQPASPGPRAYPFSCLLVTAWAYDRPDPECHSEFQLLI